MYKLWVIIKREFLSRVRKKSFLFLTVLGPLFFALIFIAPYWFMSFEEEDVKIVAVIDSSHIFEERLPDTKFLKFEYMQGVKVDDLRVNFDKLNYYAVLYISNIVSYSPTSVQLMSYRQPSLSVSMHISNSIEKEIERQKLKTFKIHNIDNILNSVKTKIQVQNIKWRRNGNDELNDPMVGQLVSYFGGLMTFLFVFMFGVQVMRGVLEEKTNRVVEVIISSVRPFQLMMGKILGVALVSLTQFLIWIIATFLIVKLFYLSTIPDVSMLAPSAGSQDIFSNSSLSVSQPLVADQLVRVTDIMSAIRMIDFSVMLFSFLFFFLAGYLLYAAMFAAIGALADNDTDVQQFMIPATIPLSIAMIVMMAAIKNPDGNLAFWFSIIPFTSPVVMMARIPSGVAYSELLLSAILLIVTFILMTYISAKLYRTGILMYGKKPSLREIFKWIRYK